MLSCQRDSIHFSSVPEIVIDSEVLCRPVVPDCQGAWLPTNSTCEVNLFAMFKQKLKQGAALTVGKSFYPDGIYLVDK